MCTSDIYLVLITLILFSCQYATSFNQTMKTPQIMFSDDFHPNFGGNRHLYQQYLRRIQSDVVTNASSTDCSIYSQEKRDINVLIDFNSWFQIHNDNDCGCDLKCNWYDMGSLNGRVVTFDIIIIMHNMHIGRTKLQQ